MVNASNQEDFHLMVKAVDCFVHKPTTNGLFQASTFHNSVRNVMNGLHELYHKYGNESELTFSSLVTVKLKGRQGLFGSFKCLVLNKMQLSYYYQRDKTKPSGERQFTRPTCVISHVEKTLVPGSVDANGHVDEIFQVKESHQRRERKT